MIKKVSSIVLLVLCYSVQSKEISVTGELEALEMQVYSPPRINNIWQYTISFMAENGTVVKQGQPILMFKTDEIQTKLMDSQGKLSIKQSELKNKKVNSVETFANKKLAIEEKKMELEKAKRKAELPKNLIAKNEYQENQLNHQLAQKQLKWAQNDLLLSRQKYQAEVAILNAKISKLSAEIEKYQAAINKMRLMSQSSGVVMHQKNWSQAKFSVGDSVWNGQRVIEVADLNHLIAKLEINESQIKNIKLNQKVKLVLDALPDKDFYGKISTIDNIVRIKSQEQPAKILEAKVTIDKVDAELMRPGMRLSAKIMAGDER